MVMINETKINKKKLNETLDKCITMLIFGVRAEETSQIKIRRNKTMTREQKRANKYQHKLLDVMMNNELEYPPHTSKDSLIAVGCIDLSTIKEEFLKYEICGRIKVYLKMLKAYNPTLNIRVNKVKEN
jgi:hypothetical protein